MRVLLSATLLLVLLTFSAHANRRTKNLKGVKQEASRASSCSPADTRFGRCVPDQGDCGDGLRDAVCLDQTEKIHCRLPCNWKKDISDCKYKFSPWGPCDPSSNTKSRSGSLKRALFNAECQSSVRVSKPCSPKVKKSRGEKKN